MKKLLLTMAYLLLMLSTHAQKLEVSVYTNSGLSFFRGAGTESISIINERAAPSDNYVSNQYGNIQAATYGFGLDAKLVITSHFLIGAQAGYENQRSRIDLRKADHNIYLYLLNTANYVYAFPQQPKGGEAILSNQFININPYLGYRINIKKVNLDLTLGEDIAISKKRLEHGSTTATDDKIVTTNYDRGKLTFNDMRFRFDIKAWYSRIGLSAGYSIGSADYTKEGITTPSDFYAAPAKTGSVYSNLLRVGLSYRLY